MSAMKLTLRERHLLLAAVQCVARMGRREIEISKREGSPPPHRVLDETIEYEALAERLKP